jgi:hypothetical protein
MDRREMIRVSHKGSCAQCGREKVLTRGLDGRYKCLTCNKGTAQARKITSNIKPKENSTEWAHSWKPLNQVALDQAELRAQQALGMAVIEEKD